MTAPAPCGPSPGSAVLRRRLALPVPPKSLTATLEPTMQLSHLPSIPERAASRPTVLS